MAAELQHKNLNAGYKTSSSAMAQRLHKLADFKGVGHCEAKF